MGKYTFKGKAAVSVAAIAALTLTGCASVGGGGNDSNGGGGDSSASAQSGGVVNVAETNKFSGANPGYTKTNLDINGHVAQMTREGFITVDPEQKIHPNEGFGTYKKVSDDPLTVEYTLKDPKWSDGNAVDKADLMLWWSLLSGYANDASEDGKAGKDYFAIAGSTDILGSTDKPEFSEDGKTMTLKWAKPNADWEIGLDSNSLMPAHVVAKKAGMSEEQLLEVLENQKKGDPKNPQKQPELEKIGKAWNESFNFTSTPEDKDVLVSNGPFTIENVVENNSVTLKKNENYSGDKPGKLDEITLRTIGDSTAQIQALRNGEVDIMQPVSVNKDTVDQVAGIDGVNVQTGDQLAYDHVDLNFGADTFKDKDVREAFLKTIPRQQIVDQIVKPVKEDAQVLNSEMFVSSQGEPYQKAVEVNKAKELYGDVDIEGAKKLLGGKTPTVRILYNNANPQRVDSFQLIKESAEKAGFKVQDLGDPNWSEKLADGDYDASLFGWISPGVGTEALSQIFKTGGGGNYNEYSNPEVDKLVDEARSNLDESSRNDQIAQVDKHVFEDAYGLPLFQSAGFVASSDKISGVDQYQPNQTGVFWNVSEWSRK
ncbi:ABC transporter family substrate-binding protein [Kocuria indica]|uniref:ABC transporter family substrate-binding protein n=1 Tax=Kocuria marina subsp. indica TaxID=1049583 RepID=A0A6N9QX66_9MICC|nr:ABC transporter family substrate-binding protein [Kocuria indica]NDO77247.1 ABC transporter family substrate-binding protein [Kocuria indica]